MKRLFALQITLAVLFFLLTAVCTARLLSVHLGWKLGLAGRDIATLKPETVRYLTRLPGKVSLTYFVSSRSVMPSSMQRVEAAVRALLAALKAGAPQQIDYRIIDPAVDLGDGTERVPPGESYAAQRSASPMKVRRVIEDASAEQVIWSTLAIQHERYPDALIRSITPEDLPYLEDLIIENLQAGPNPPKPVIAVSTPGRGYSQLPGFITSFSEARLIPLDLDRDPRIPPEADALFWIAPARVSDAHRRELERFIATGRSVLLAGSSYAVESVVGIAGKSTYRIRRSSCDWETLLAPFGLTMIPRLLLDTKRHEVITWRLADGSERPVDAPFQLRILPSQTDTRSLRGPSTGALLVSAASAFEPAPRRLRAAGLSVETVSTTSEFTAALDFPEGEFTDEAFSNAEPVPKQPWLVLVKSDDPWKGSLLAAGSAVLFHDDVYDAKYNANRVFLRTLLRTLTERSRLIRSRLPRVGPERVGTVSLPSRVVWRGIAVFFVPLVLMLLALRRRRLFTARTGVLPVVTRIAAGLALFLAAGMVFWGLRSWWSPFLDLTAGKTNTPSPLTSRLIENQRDELEVEILASDQLFMPPSLKGVERRAIDTLRAFGLGYRITRPEDLTHEQQAALKSQGIEPFDAERIQDDIATTNRVWCGLRIRLGDQSTVVPRLDTRTIEHLEFLLAAAVKRLGTGTGPLVGVLSDLPRLSPAEAHMDYQQKGYTAPIGADVYSFTKSLLKHHGYRVVYINPQAPVFPEGMDVLLWLQPRYSIKVLPQFGAYLAGGGKAIVALQHYNVLQQQFRGIGFSTVYWPRPQFHRFNQYLQILGMRQVGEKLGHEPGEVLFDRNHGHLVLDTQVKRSAFQEHHRQQVSRPFLVRAIADGLSQSSVITSQLGELLFIWPSRFTFDDAKMARLGLRREILVRSSPVTWVYSWSGGRIPEEAQEEPQTGLLGAQCLAALVTGRFPRIEIKKDETGRQSVAASAEPSDAATPEGALCLVGCSEMFKNQHLYLPQHQHAELLLNAAAFLGYGQEMAEIAARRRTVRSFPALGASVTLNLRLFAIVLSPLVFFLCGILWRIVRRAPLVSR